LRCVDLGGLGVLGWRGDCLGPDAVLAACCASALGDIAVGGGISGFCTRGAGLAVDAGEDVAVLEVWLRGLGGLRSEPFEALVAALPGVGGVVSSSGGRRERPGGERGGGAGRDEAEEQR